MSSSDPREPSPSACPRSTGARFDDCTVIPNAASDALAWPSVTLIVMPLKVPTPDAVPSSRPVVVLNVAHEGRFVMLNVSELPSGSLAVGVNE